MAASKKAEKAVPLLLVLNLKYPMNIVCRASAEGRLPGFYVAGVTLMRAASGNC